MNLVEGEREFSWSLVAFSTLLSLKIDGEIKGEKVCDCAYGVNSYKFLPCHTVEIRISLFRGRVNSMG